MVVIPGVVQCGGGARLQNAGALFSVVDGIDCQDFQSDVPSEPVTVLPINWRASVWGLRRTSVLPRFEAMALAS
jgi:hypothetical protein